MNSDGFSSARVCKKTQPPRLLLPCINASPVLSVISLAMSIVAELISLLAIGLAFTFPADFIEGDCTLYSWTFIVNNPHINIAVARQAFWDSGWSGQCYSALIHGPRSIALSFEFNRGGWKSNKIVWWNHRWLMLRPNVQSSVFVVAVEDWILVEFRDFLSHPTPWGFGHGASQISGHPSLLLLFLFT